MLQCTYKKSGGFGLSSLIIITGLLVGSFVWMAANRPVTPSRMAQLPTYPTQEPNAAVLASTTSCIAYGVDDIAGFNSRVFSADILNKGAATYLTPLYIDYNLEGFDYDPYDNLFYAVSGGGSRPGLYVIPPDFSEVHLIVNDPNFDRLYGLAYHRGTKTLYAASGSTAGNKGLVKITKSGKSVYNGKQVFDTMTLVKSDPGNAFSGVAWYNDYLYGIESSGKLFRATNQGEPNGFMQLSEIAGLPLTKKKYEAMEITKEGIMIIGVHDSAQTDLVSVDITKDPPVVLEQFNLGPKGLEDIEGLVWPDDCRPPLSRLTDLEAKNLSYTGRKIVGNQHTFSGQVENKGPGGVGNTSARFCVFSGNYIASDGTKCLNDATNRHGTDQPVNSLNEGQTVTVNASAPWTPVSAGNYTLYFCVDANNQVIESDESLDSNCEYDSFTVSGGAIPTRTPTPAFLLPPTRLTHTCTAQGTSCTIRWNASAGATSYAVRIDDKVNPWGAYARTYPGDYINDTITRRTYTFVSQPGHTYDWWVHAINSKGWSNQSVIDRFTAPNPATATPTRGATITPVNTLIPTSGATPTLAPSGNNPYCPV